MTGRRLRPRQHEVLLLVAHGNTNNQIGRTLGITPGAVNEHLGNAYQALGVHDRAHAVAVALHLGELAFADLHPPTVAGTEGTNSRTRSHA